MNFTPLELEIQDIPLLSEDFAHTSTASDGPTVAPASSVLPTLPPNRRSSHTNIIARIQALLPHSSPAASTSTTTVDVTTPDTPCKKPPAPEPFIKVRIMSWNMHDTLPKGDLDELLGVVPPYTPLDTSNNTANPIPLLPSDANHPYHIVIIAGQECPTSSAIPKGLSTGFRSKEKHQERERQREKEKERDINGGGHSWSLDEDRDVLQHVNTSGWSYIIEDWHRYGTSGDANHHVPQVDAILPKSPTTSNMLTPDSSPYPSVSEGKSSGTVVESRQGPYVLLTKERLMGIYLAVYVHRDVRQFVKGHSKSSVTAGLIGGRVGNKGGVGISLKIYNTSFLFINAHLAAHEGKVHHRIANLTKIKAGLAVDDFLDPNDPRQMKEDLTERFDQCFVFGDLNFRLDVTRLHADWLISRKEYGQALEFDQLRNIMRNGQSFAGFHEGPIDFPPTFKYDVLRTLKHKRKKDKEIALQAQGISELDERVEEHEEDVIFAEDDDSDEACENGESGDATSLVSTTRASTRTRLTAQEVDDDDYFHSDSTPVLSSSSRGTVTTPSPVPSKYITTGVNKAKSKWMALISTSSAVGTLIPGSAQLKPSLSSRRIAPSPILAISQPGTTPPQASPRFVSDPMTPLVKPIKNAALALAPALKRVNSTRSGRSGPMDNDRDVGVYDSSSKQRVPSWCDRILWKSSVVEEERPRNRLGSRLHQALRRSRHNSLASSLDNASILTLSSASHTVTPAESPAVTISAAGMPPPVKPRLAKSQSADPLLIPDPSNLMLDGTTSQLPTPVTNEMADEPGIMDNTMRRSSTGIPLVKTQTMPTSAPPPQRQGTTHSQDTIASHSLSWLRFFPFGSREPSTRSGTGTTVPNRPSTPELVVSVPRHRRGDVVCLYYNTLDDRAMRKLEGRSDHRPVMGSYAVYI